MNCRNYHNCGCPSALEREGKTGRERMGQPPKSARNGPTPSWPSNSSSYFEKMLEGLFFILISKEKEPRQRHKMVRKPIIGSCFHVGQALNKCTLERIERQNSLVGKQVNHPSVPVLMLDDDNVPRLLPLFLPVNLCCPHHVMLANAATMRVIIEVIFVFF